MNSAKILLIGDELNILRTLRRNLVGRGYLVQLALDDQEVVAMTSAEKFDLFIINLDFETDEVDGLHICRKIREVSHAPAIVLSSIDSEKTKVEALDLGADDYLVMPFGMSEFLARVRSALRRWATFQSSNTSHSSVILTGELFIDTESRQVTLRGEQVHLTPTEYELLQYLAQNGGKVLTHRELLQSVWGPEYGDEREYLRVFISQLRRKIEANPLRPCYIVTEPGVGYRFAAEK